MAAEVGGVRPARRRTNTDRARTASGLGGAQGGPMSAASSSSPTGKAAPEGYAPASLLRKLGAHVIDRIPRGSASQYDFLIRPENSGLPEPAWMSSCL